MGRSRGSKFSFPIPGRRAQAKESAANPTAPQHPTPQWPSHLEDPTSKAHRVLGTSEVPVFRSSPRQTPTIPASPTHMTMTVSSETSYCGRYDDWTPATATEYTKRPAMSRRPSSNILGSTGGGTTRQGSDNSSTSYRLQPQTSSSTMRSHYDANTSPLSISQQTSNSAVRDMALRRGKPQVITHGHGCYTYDAREASPVSPMLDARKREHRRSRPARLDLSKLFPKPRSGGDVLSYSNSLLSPNKMVNSPAAMSMNSEYFAQPMTREPTPAPKGHAKLTKHATRRHARHAPVPASPKRLFKRDEYDSAKVHVRRPPKGVQHWFDALDEDSDEALEEASAPVYAPQAQRPGNTPKMPLRKTSLSGIYQGAVTSGRAPRPQKSVPGFKNDSFSHEDMIDVNGLTSPSQFSLHTQNSTKTKESTLSKHNLKDSSCLSFSSSEDEFDGERHAIRRFAVRKSLNMDDDAGEIIFGQAQAFELRSNRMPPERKLSIMSTSTSAATIDIMYTPEPFSPPNFSRISNHSGSRRSSHLRQPSVILEDEDGRPNTAAYAPHSSAYSIRSTQTSASEPQPRPLATERKMMAVTPEEEALLELMRKKRASMAKQSSTSMSEAYIEQEGQRQKALDALQNAGRKPAFLATESLATNPVRVVEMKPKRKSVAASSTSSLHLTPPPRGRPKKTSHDAHTTSALRDSSVSDSEGFGFPIARGSIPHHIPTSGAFSPLDPFPSISPSHTASLTSPTTIDHVSPLPSPITPGPCSGDSRDTVKIASSDTSADSEEVVPDSDLSIHIIQAAKSLDKMELSHQRRRTASSGADMSFPIPPTYGAKDLAAVSEASISSCAPSIVEPVYPALMLPERSAKRQGALKMALEQRSRQSSVVSNASSHSNASSFNTSSLRTGRERSRHASRGSSVASMTRSSKARNSVSDDVLAAWGSLGGTY